MEFGEKHIHYTKKEINGSSYEYYNIRIIKNNRVVLSRYLNMEVYTLDEAIAERDAFLAENKDKFEFEKEQRKILRGLGIKIK